MSNGNWVAIWLGLMAVALGGCNQKPTYVRPEVPLPSQWPDLVAYGGREVRHLDWRTFFTDPRLKALIALALENSRDLRVAMA